VQSTLNGLTRTGGIYTSAARIDCKVGVPTHKPFACKYLKDYVSDTKVDALAFYRHINRISSKGWEGSETGHVVGLKTVQFGVVGTPQLYSADRIA
jgi:hypothetical protein